jgi:hypothetical protein
MKRLSLLLLLACLLGACASPTPTLTPAGPTPAAPARAGQLLGLDILESADTEAPYDLADAAGARWIRFPLRWDQVEPRRQDPARYRWDNYDAIFAALHARGFRVMLTVRDNPRWAADTSCGPLHAAGQIAFAQMLDAAARRYSVEGYDIHHWEFYNEPDNRSLQYGSQGGCWGDAPAAYAEMLALAHDAIEAADPDATIILGGLALEKIEGDPFNLDFLQQVLDAGGAAHFDWMNFHYYPAFSYRWDRYGVGVQGKASYVRGMLQKAGVEKPVICSEIGQPSAGPANESYSDEKTMALIYRELARAISADLEAIIWHKLVDRPGESRLYGLLTPELEAKPAYATYRALTTALAHARFAGPLSAAESGSKQIEAYRFALDDGPHDTLLIAWNTAEDGQVAMVLPATEATVTDIYGQETVLPSADSASTGKLGELRITLSSSPVLIAY